MAHYLLKCVQNTTNLHKGFKEQKRLNYISVYYMETNYILRLLVH